MTLPRPFRARCPYIRISAIQCAPVVANTLPGRSNRSGRRRPFSTLMKKLANLKAGGHGDGSLPGSKRKSTKKRPSKNNNPYPESGRIEPNRQYDSQPSLSTARTGRTASASSVSGRTSTEHEPPATAGARSMAPTFSTDHDTSRSITAPSHRASSLGGTSRTAHGGVESRRGGDSTFSSPAPSVRSLATTLTTIQSLAANGGTNNNPGSQSNHHGHQYQHSATIHFNQPFPTASPASAIPSHLTPTTQSTGHPTTYATATANNLLTDNASILTLASSSKQRRRRSFDTDASVRALAPSSLFGGSRESLPLSVLSATIDGIAPTTPGLHRGASAVGAERTSIYSATGILASERNSFYAKQGLNAGAGTQGDGASIRSGLFGHGRADSVTGSIGGGLPTSPLASPRDYLAEKEKTGVEEEEEEEREKDGDYQLPRDPERHPDISEVETETEKSERAEDEEVSQD